MGSQDNKKKPYSPPTLTKLTPEQARKLVADRKKFNEEKAAIAFLKALSRQPTSNATNQKRKRSA
jgi:transcriptional regulator of met regulon